MKLFYFKIPCKGQVEAEIEAESEEEARAILETDDWEMYDDFCFDPDVRNARLTNTSPT